MIYLQASIVSSILTLGHTFSKEEIVSDLAFYIVQRMTYNVPSKNKRIANY